MRLNLSENDAKLLNLALNKISGEWDEDRLMNLLAQLNKDGVDLSLSGFSDSELEEFVTQLETISIEELLGEVKPAKETPPQWAVIMAEPSAVHHLNEALSSLDGVEGNSSEEEHQMKMGTRKKKDSSSLDRKVALRRKYLPPLATARVLDLFCGAGEIYRMCYTEVEEYVGVDNTKIHTPTAEGHNCVLTDNYDFVRRHNIDRYNSIDLDAYGCPWLLLLEVVRRSNADDLTVFVTDGLPLRLMSNSRPPKVVQAVAGIPKGFKFPTRKGVSPVYFYEHIFAHLLYHVESYGWQVLMAKYCWNKEHTVAYWVIKLSRKT